VASVVVCGLLWPLLWPLGLLWPLLWPLSLLWPLLWPRPVVACCSFCCGPFFCLCCGFCCGPWATGATVVVPGPVVTCGPAVSSVVAPGPVLICCSLGACCGMCCGFWACCGLCCNLRACCGLCCGLWARCGLWLRLLCLLWPLGGCSEAGPAIPNKRCQNLLTSLLRKMCVNPGGWIIFGPICSGLPWATLGCSWLLWAAQGCPGLFKAFVGLLPAVIQGRRLGSQTYGVEIDCRPSASKCVLILAPGKYSPQSAT